MENNKDGFRRLSSVTGKIYNVFECVRIMNIYQAIVYMDNDIFPVDIKVVSDEDTKKKQLMFLFNKNDTMEIYRKWRNRELD